jgi:flagellar biosynthetic protein FlhB
VSESSGERTEKPTPYRIEKAREQGQVAKSQDFNGAVIVGTTYMMTLWAGQYAYQTIVSISTELWGKPFTKALTVTSSLGLINDLVLVMVLIMLPFIGAMMVTGVLGNLVQVKPLFAIQAIQPKFDKINPVNGFKRLWSLRSVIEVVKALLKMGIIGWASFSIIDGHVHELWGLSSMSLNEALSVLSGIMGHVALWVVIILTVLGIADWWYQAYELEKQLRMSKQDIKDERKNQEGNPLLKGRIRQIGREMSRKRQLSAVPTADVIVTNPTHLSIAIQYNPEIEPAPRIIAKGADHFAMKIREVAKDHNILLVENKPLAQTLYKTVEVGHMIPPELFIAVAEVLAYVYTRNRQRRPKKRSLKPAGGGPPNV